MTLLVILANDFEIIGVISYMMSDLVRGQIQILSFLFFLNPSLVFFFKFLPP